MHHDEMPTVLEMICKGCAINNCRSHESMTTGVDTLTQLKVVVVCACPKCN